MKLAFNHLKGDFISGERDRIVLDETENATH